MFDKSCKIFIVLTCAKMLAKMATTEQNNTQEQYTGSTLADTESTLEYTSSTLEFTTSTLAVQYGH